MQPLLAPSSSGAIETFLRYLPGGFAAASLDGEARDRFDAIACGLQGVQGLGQSEAQWADYSCRDDCDTDWPSFSV